MKYTDLIILSKRLYTITNSFIYRGEIVKLMTLSQTLVKKYYLRSHDAEDDIEKYYLSHDAEDDHVVPPAAVEADFLVPSKVSLLNCSIA